MGPQIGLVAGEASGDLLASSVLSRWRELPAASQPVCAGIGGPGMQAQGFEAWWPSEWLAVHGYSAAIRALPRLLWVRRQLRQRLLRWPARAFIGVDAPDFNLGLEMKLRAAGVRTYHFVSPSIWAWRRERIDKIRQAVDHMLLVFPFEEAIYREAGIPATYVGHPLADQIPADIDRAAARRVLDLDDDAVVIALLPGSRQAEVEHLAPVFLATAAILHQRHPQWQFILPAASEARLAELRAMVREQQPDLPLRILAGQSHTALAACDQTLIASGTATLEAALFKRPMVIAYRMSAMSYRLMKGRNYQPWFGLPNILANEFLVPEFIQDAATPPALADALEQQLLDAAGCERLVSRFAEMHQSLARGCAQAVADTVLADLDRHGGSPSGKARLDRHGGPASGQTDLDRHGRGASGQAGLDQCDGPTSGQVDPDSHGRSTSGQAYLDQRGGPASGQADLDRHGGPTSGRASGASIDSPASSSGDHS